MTYSSDVRSELAVPRRSLHYGLW